MQTFFAALAIISIGAFLIYIFLIPDYEAEKRELRAIADHADYGPNQVFLSNIANDLGTRATIAATSSEIIVIPLTGRGKSLNFSDVKSFRFIMWGQYYSRNYRPYTGKLEERAEQIDEPLTHTDVAENIRNALPNRAPV